MNQKFTVISSNANKSGGYVWKLQTAAEVKVFGVTKTIKRTYYIGGMPVAANIGAVVEESLEKFDIVERGFSTKNAEGNEIIIMLKWLHAKQPS